ncbi:MAG: class I SAM-dependent methyltransferase [Saprospiraceae bacterium]
MSDKFGLKLEMFANRLKKVLRIRSKIVSKQGISCYRLYDLDMPEFPFCIDVYEDKIYVAEYQRQHILNEEEYKEWFHQSLAMIAQVLEVQNTHVFVKHRKVIEERVDQYHKLADVSRSFEVLEGGHRFIINLSDYLDTGLFLDHRITRGMVGTESKDKSVLNLFAYTGSFSVYAAKGGAKQVTTIDLSNTYIQWARRNFEINQLDPNLYEFIVTDVMAWLQASHKEKYDIIVCDPPTFSNSKKMDGVFDVQRDHVKMISQCCSLLKVDGKLYFSTNFSKFKLRSEELLDYRIKDLTRATTPFDFEGKLERKCYLIQKSD